MSIFGFFGGNLLRLARRDSRLAARGSGSQARKIASPIDVSGPKFTFTTFLGETKVYNLLATREPTLMNISFVDWISNEIYAVLTPLFSRLDYSYGAEGFKSGHGYCVDCGTLFVWLT